MGLSSAGIGSNLDVDGIVAKLMSVEQQPLTKLAKKEASYQAKLSGFGTLKGALSQFQSAVKDLANVAKFQGVTSSVADPAVATVSGTNAATAGAYSLKVTQLAQTQKLVANGVASQIAPIGSGVISFDFGTISGGTFANGKYSGGASFASSGSGIKTVTIDPSNNSLSGIRDAINAAAIGVTATIVNDGGSSPYRLALSSALSGKAGSIKITLDSASDPALSALLNHDPAATQGLSETASARNAELSVDGIAVSKPSNTITDMITGVTLNLLKESAGTATSVSIARDTASVATAVNGFVKAYNDISQTLRDASAYNATTRTAAILNGEASVRTIQTQLRSILSTSVAGGASAFTGLSQIGVSMQKDGLLAVDNGKLTTALNANFAGFAGLFAAAGKTSDSLISYTGAAPTTTPGAYAVTVSALATQGATRATGAANLDITASNNTLTVQLNGVPATITLGIRQYANGAELAAELQSKINGVAAFATAGSSASVTQTGGVLSITSNRYGSSSSVSVSGAGQPSLLFDTSGPNVSSGIDVAGTINGAPGTGSGQLLVASGGDASGGLSVTISGGIPGPRGTINYSRGYAYQFDQLASQILGTGGTIDSRTEGIGASIKSLTGNRTDLSARLATTEKRYRAQFTALDLVISKMNTTSTFLSQQLAQISSISSR